MNSAEEAKKLYEEVANIMPDCVECNKDSIKSVCVLILEKQFEVADGLACGSFSNEIYKDTINEINNL